MKKILTKLNEWKFIILAIIVLGGYFYWFQVRPSMAYSSCNLKAKESLKGKSNVSGEGLLVLYDTVYKVCLRSKGINK